MSSASQSVKKYHIAVTRESDTIAKATAHGVSLKVSMNGEKPELGLTAPETVIAGYSACLMTNIGKAAKAMNLKIDDVQIEFEGTKRTEPLGMTDLRCKITIGSDESEDRVRTLFERATSDGTATNAIHEGFRARFELARG